MLEINYILKTIFQVEAPCYLANICNHTWIAECGYDKSISRKRIFLDECDRFEYNCDHKKGWSFIKYLH